MTRAALKKAKRTKKLSPYRELWQAAGGLLSNAEDPKFVKTTPDSGLLHATHTAWNALAVLELKLRGQS